MRVYLSFESSKAPTDTISRFWWWSCHPTRLSTAVYSDTTEKTFDEFLWRKYYGCCVQSDKLVASQARSQLLKSQQSVCLWNCVWFIVTPTFNSRRNIIAQFNDSPECFQSPSRTTHVSFYSPWNDTQNERKMFKLCCLTEKTKIRFELKDQNDAESLTFITASGKWMRVWCQIWKWKPQQELLIFAWCQYR